MSPQTAKAIFNMLFDALRANNFEAVGTFLLSERRDEIFYEDSGTALEQLYQQAQISQGANRALRLLVDATRNYLEMAANLPTSYDQEIQSFQDDSINATPRLLLYVDDSNDQTDVRQILVNPAVYQLQRLLAIVAEFSGNSLDDIFFTELNNNYP